MRVYRFLLFPTLILLMGCPSLPAPTYPHTDGDGALHALRNMRRPAMTIRAEARVEQWGEEGRIRGTVLMFVERPESVRFDAMTQFGPAAILTSDGVRFSLTDMRENRFLSGPTCPENISRLLGIPMSGADVTLFLLGDTPRIEADERDIEWSDEGTYLVTLRQASGRRQEIELGVREWDRESPPDEQRLRLVRSEVFDASGDTEWRATLDDHQVIVDPRSESDPPMGIAMPFKIRFEHPAQNADTSVRFESIDLNVNVPDGAFTQSSPPGISAEEVPCQ